jgi:hypothetical protein
VISFFRVCVMDFVNDYFNGNEPDVWDRLCAAGDIGHDLNQAADLVAIIAMRRARRNIERLIPRWEARGHKFGYQWAGAWAASYVKAAPPLLGNPNAADLEMLDQYERERGAIPVALRAFYEVIGAVNFVGTVAKGWPNREILDPLQVEDFSSQLPALLSAQTDEVVICPDMLLKYFIGSVGPLTVKLPSHCFDPVLRFEGGDLRIDGKPLTFGSYLRDVILNRGAIGLVAGYNDDAPDPALTSFLTQGLEPF